MVEIENISSTDFKTENIFLQGDERMMLAILGMVTAKEETQRARGDIESADRLNEAGLELAKQIEEEIEKDDNIARIELPPEHVQEILSVVSEASDAMKSLADIDSKKAADEIIGKMNSQISRQIRRG